MPREHCMQNGLNKGQKLYGCTHAYTHTHTHTYTASQVVLVVKNLPANAVDMRDLGLIPESGRCPGGGYDNPLQYSCWENPVDRGAWWATVYRFAKS